MYVKRSGGYSSWQSTAARRNRLQDRLDQQSAMAELRAHLASQSADVAAPQSTLSAASPIRSPARLPVPEPSRQRPVPSRAAQKRSLAKANPAMRGSGQNRAAAGPKSNQSVKQPESPLSRERRERFRLSMGRAAVREGRQPVADRMDALCDSALGSLTKEQRVNVRAYLQNMRVRLTDRNPSPEVIAASHNLWVALAVDRCEKTWSILVALATPPETESLFVSERDEKPAPAPKPRA